MSASTSTKRILFERGALSLGFLGAIIPPIIRRETKLGTDGAPQFCGFNPGQHPRADGTSHYFRKLGNVPSVPGFPPAPPSAVFRGWGSLTWLDGRVGQLARL